MNIKVGQILDRKDGEGSQKVLAVVGEIVCMSLRNKYERISDWYTREELEKYFNLPKEEWIPKDDENYFGIANNGVVFKAIWANDKIDNARKSFLGIYKTKEEAETALADIKKKLGSN